MLLGTLRLIQPDRVPKTLQINRPKIKLWLTVAQATASKSLPGDAGAILNPLQKTEAWRQASCERDNSKNKQKHHIIKEALIIKKLRTDHHNKIFLWHHHDPLSYVPRTWHHVLGALLQADWTVVISSSTLTHRKQQELMADGFIVCTRENIGRCIGAYKDFCRLLHDNKHIIPTPCRLVLSNDSTLPTCSGSQFVEFIDLMFTNLSNYKPALAGVTDSVERNRYHLQSYLLACNQISLENEAWWSFWKQLETDGDKDRLIDEGEIGLSQAMLRAGASLSAMHRLGDLMETNNKKEHKMSYLQNKKPEEINQTLHAWAKLLAKGCPIIKKQLFVGPGSEFAFLHNWNAAQMLLPDAIKQDFFNDLQRLLQSRYYDPS
jgi:hypothetical protein